MRTWLHKFRAVSVTMARLARLAVLSCQLRTGRAFQK
jgi:hypothetical protein